MHGGAETHVVVLIVNYKEQGCCWRRNQMSLSGRLQHDRLTKGDKLALVASLIKVAIDLRLRPH